MFFNQEKVIQKKIPMLMKSVFLYQLRSKRHLQTLVSIWVCTCHVHVVLFCFAATVSSSAAKQLNHDCKDAVSAPPLTVEKKSSESTDSETAGQFTLLYL